MRRFLQKLRYVRLGDVASIPVLLLAAPFAFILRARRPHIWLICERRGEARDNGFWLYRYLLQNQPQVDAVYVIDSASTEAARVQALGGEVIQWGGLRHWAYYLAAEYNVSSQKDGKPNAAVCYLLEVYGILKNRRAFLQHGIIHNDNEFLHYENTRMGLFVCGARPEYDYVRRSFGYPEGTVRYLGLARFDGLHHFQAERLVLVMPTWRRSIATPARFSRRLDTSREFVRTTYYRKWHELLCDEGLKERLSRHGYRVAFYPHPNMQRFLDAFREGCEGVEFCDWRTCDLQDLLRRAAFLVTDYSSVAMDFAYMQKPLLYYQFDLDEFRANQYKAGYFDFVRDGFGPVCTTEGEAAAALASWAERGRNEDEYLARCRSFFELHDECNCQRNYEAIRDWGNHEH